MASVDGAAEYLDARRSYARAIPAQKLGIAAGKSRAGGGGNVARNAARTLVNSDDARHLAPEVQALLHETGEGVSQRTLGGLVSNVRLGNALGGQTGATIGALAHPALTGSAQKVVNGGSPHDLVALARVMIAQGVDGPTAAAALREAGASASVVARLGRYMTLGAVGQAGEQASVAAEALAGY